MWERLTQRIKRKLRGQAGRVSVVLLVLFALVALAGGAAFFIPALLDYAGDAGDVGCALAMESAQRKLDETLIIEGDMDVAAAKRAATQDVAEFDSLCPAGGEVHLSYDAGTGRYIVSCGLHDTDLERRCRRNAEVVLERLRSALERSYLLENNAVPDTLTVELNGEELEAQRVTEPPALFRGTGSTPGYEGTVVFYILRDGKLVRFLFADESHCMTWRELLGWDMDLDWVLLDTVREDP